jgi:hypothetical protein
MQQKMIRKQSKTTNTVPIVVMSPRDSSPRGYLPTSPLYIAPTEFEKKAELNESWEKFEKKLENVRGFYMETNPWGSQVKKNIQSRDLYKAKRFIAEIVKGHLKYTDLYRLSKKEKEIDIKDGPNTMQYKKICKSACDELLVEGKYYKTPRSYKREIYGIIMNQYNSNIPDPIDEE